MFRYILLLLFTMILMTSCTSYDDTDRTPSVVGDINDSISWYSDSNNDVLEMKITIPTVNDFLCAPYDNLSYDLRPCTLEDVYNDTDPYDTYKPELHVRVDIDGLEPMDEGLMNATLRQKGKTTREAKQKSYRIKLDSNAGLFKGERTFQINKHFYDKSRINQRVFFELFKSVPNFTSLKTRFIHLKVNNEDYGFFTHTEAVDEYFLKNRGWSEEDQLYKAQNFTFRNDARMAIKENGKPVNKDTFESMIEPKNGPNDHRKLIEMIDKIYNSSSDKEFNKNFSYYFNRENYITWLAINIVVANKDTVSQNFFLYKPKHSDVFYFLPWDYDDIGQSVDQLAKWEIGISNWWDVPLHRKFLQIEQNRKDLDDKVTFLRDNYFQPSEIEQKVNQYKEILKSYVEVEPDTLNLDLDVWEDSLKIISPQIDKNINAYRAEFGSPMPFWQTPITIDGVSRIWWDLAVDFEKDEIVYDLFIADNPDFENPLVVENNMSIKNGKIVQPDEDTLTYGEVYYNVLQKLPKGTYYSKIIAKELNTVEHRYQITFNKEVEIGQKKYFGVREFKVE